MVTTSLGHIKLIVTNHVTTDSHACRVIGKPMALACKPIEPGWLVLGDQKKLPQCAGCPVKHTKSQVDDKYDSVPTTH